MMTSGRFRELVNKHGYWKAVDIAEEENMRELREHMPAAEYELLRARVCPRPRNYRPVPVSVAGKIGQFTKI